jgi:hypothetical protein
LSDGISTGRVLAANAERFEETLTDRRDRDAGLAHPIIDDGFADGRVFGRIVPGDLKRTNACALLAAGTQEQSAIAGQSEQVRYKFD